MNILGKRYIFFGLSLLIIVIGFAIIMVNGIPLSIDFTGGSLLEVTFEGKTPGTSDIILLYESAGITDAQVQTAVDPQKSPRIDLITEQSNAAG